MKVCKHCGSTHIVRDAWVEWDDTAGDWTVSEIFDDGYCFDCEACQDIVADKPAAPKE